MALNKGLYVFFCVLSVSLMCAPNLYSFIYSFIQSFAFAIAAF